MPILPLPQFEADLAEQDREIYERLKPPSSIVARFGIMYNVGEFPYDGDAKPGCGSKLVIKTHRGTELGEMLTSTCPNAGCSKSVTRKEMLQYIENSGGKDYPFFSMQGRVLRIATPEDLNRQAQLDSSRTQLVRQARALVQNFKLDMKIVDAEPILGGERLTFYFASESRVDFRELVAALAAEHHTRIELRQVGARDEARLTADFEKCGQHCCCKQFLKVLKPISMKSAKIQKATLDPLKISGRCGRLMCCLRYEDQTYDELRKRLPKKKSRVRTEDGWGTVLDGQILTQLVLVALDNTAEPIALPIENLLEIAPAGTNMPAAPAPGAPAAGPPGRRDGPRSGPGTRPGPRRPDAPRDRAPGAAPSAPGSSADRPPRRDRDRDRDRPRDAQPDSRREPRRDAPADRPPRPQGAPPQDREAEIDELLNAAAARGADSDPEFDQGAADDSGADRPSSPDSPAAGPDDAPGPRKRRRRRRRRGKGGGGGGGDGGPTGDAGPNPAGGNPPPAA
ncbi:MAG: hypothetical protein KF768_09185 [Phycisphaeraceae bacterium]|nr:hypothetical protein [Phycisphaeraceae bacterium]